MPDRCDVKPTESSLHISRGWSEERMVTAYLDILGDTLPCLCYEAIAAYAVFPAIVFRVLSEDRMALLPREATETSPAAATAAMGLVVHAADAGWLGAHAAVGGPVTDKPAAASSTLPPTLDQDGPEPRMAATYLGIMGDALPRLCYERIAAYAAFPRVFYCGREWHKPNTAAGPTWLGAHAAVGAPTAFMYIGGGVE